MKSPLKWYNQPGTKIKDRYKVYKRFFECRDVCIWKNRLDHKAWIQRHFSLPHIVPRICFLLYLTQQKIALFQAYSTRIRFFFPFFNDSAFRQHETSELAHQNRIFLKPLGSEVVKKIRTQLSGLKKRGFKKCPNLCGRGFSI